jgi:hypothetical protein
MEAAFWSISSEMSLPMISKPSRASAPVNRPVPQGRSSMVRTPVASRSALAIAAHLRRLRVCRSGELKRWKS